MEELVCAPKIQVPSFISIISNAITNKRNKVYICFQ